VNSVEDALRVIDADGSAVLPDGAWSLAEDVLRALGCDERMVEDRIHFAQTGQTLYDV